MRLELVLKTSLIARNARSGMNERLHVDIESN